MSLVYYFFGTRCIYVHVVRIKKILVFVILQMRRFIMNDDIGLLPVSH